MYPVKWFRSEIWYISSEMVSHGRVMYTHRYGHVMRPVKWFNTERDACSFNELA